MATSPPRGYPGSARQLLNDAGHVTASTNYDPYGTPEGTVLPSPFGYTGELTDPATGSQYLRARWYRPGQGTLLGVDPLLAQTGQAYSYANDNPVNGSDPSGLFDPCHAPVLGGICNGVSGAWDHVTSSVGRYVRDALLRDLFDVNGLLVKVAQSGFADGVNDGVIEFAKGVQGLPGAVKGHLDTLGYYAQHPGDAAPLVKGLAFGLIKQVLSTMVFPEIGAVQGLIQVLHGLWDVVQELRHSAACGTLGHDLGKRFASLVLGAAVGVLGGKFIGAVADVLRGEELFAAEATGDRVAIRALVCDACFPAGTRVATVGGSVPIDRLHVGDTVLAEDTKSGKVRPERVLAVIDDGVKPTLALNLSDGSSLRVTANHPFYVDGGPGIAHPEWLAAGNLQAGDRLRTKGGKDVTILQVRYHAGYAHVYTLTVATDHDFFVGAAGALVHNQDANPPPPLNDPGGVQYGSTPLSKAVYDRRVSDNNFTDFNYAAAEFYDPQTGIYQVRVFHSTPDPDGGTLHAERLAADYATEHKLTIKSVYSELSPCVNKRNGGCAALLRNLGLTSDNISYSFEHTRSGGDLRKVFRAARWFRNECK